MVARFSDLGVWGASGVGNALLPKALASKRLQGQPFLKHDWYGLGIWGTNSVGGEWIGHYGNLPGWQSMLFYNPSTGTTVAIVTTRCGNDFDFVTGLLPTLYPR